MVIFFGKGVPIDKLLPTCEGTQGEVHTSAAQTAAL
ncbi:unnamed protein product [Chondrus crispus]|uniref:Uncharacterized protein n=1 Tax=Chondrus crispus TaxID=2769 RepID=R7Q544_CHOCR|nr:unnamed protein product [Chondrus crispus]CDF33144.1 unnamed protein product [Chondrus crispus]|eukprot:XP_005712947.1 unnamed protein product [Chondrus crispus]